MAVLPGSPGPSDIAGIVVAVVPFFCGAAVRVRDIGLAAKPEEVRLRERGAFYGNGLCVETSYVFYNRRHCRRYLISDFSISFTFSTLPLST